MRNALAIVAVALAACAPATSTTAGPARNSIEATLAVPSTDAAARVQAAMVDQGIAVEQAQPTLVVGVARDQVGQGERAGTFLRISASLLPAGDSTRVVLTGVGIRPAAFGLPEASRAVTSGGGGTEGAMWQRLERLAAALAP